MSYHRIWNLELMVFYIASCAVRQAMNRMKPVNDTNEKLPGTTLKKCSLKHVFRVCQPQLQYLLLRIMISQLLRQTFRNHGVTGDILNGKLSINLGGAGFAGNTQMTIISDPENTEAKFSGLLMPSEVISHLHFQQ